MNSMYRYHRRSKFELENEIETISKKIETAVDDYIRSAEYKKLFENFEAFKPYASPESGDAHV